MFMVLRMGNEHVIPEFIEKIKKNKKNYIYIEGTGKEVRSLYILMILLMPLCC